MKRMMQLLALSACCLVIKADHRRSRLLAPELTSEIRRIVSSRPISPPVRPGHPVLASTSHILWTIEGGQGGCRVGAVRPGAAALLTALPVARHEPVAGLQPGE